MGSSQTRAGTRVPCIGRQILNHCATREALWIYFLWLYYYKVLGNFLIYEGLSATKKTSWFQNPSIFKIYLLISNGTGWVSWEENSEMEIKCAESLLGDQHPQERVKQGVKEYFSYLAGREILCEAVTTMIQKILKGFKSGESLVELCWTGARWLALFSSPLNQLLNAGCLWKESMGLCEVSILSWGQLPHKASDGCCSEWQWQGALRGQLSSEIASSEGNQLVQGYDTFPGDLYRLIDQYKDIKAWTFAMDWIIAHPPPRIYLEALTTLPICLYWK